MSIEDRIESAIDRITSGQGCMRVPPDETDPDLVLADCRDEIARLRAESDALRVDAMRYRFIRDADRCDQHIRYEELLMYAEENLDEAIDAAMGA